MLKSLFTYFIFSAFLKFGQPAEQIQFLEDQFKKYIVNYQRFKNDYSCSYINVNSEDTKDVSNVFIKHNQCPSVVVGDNFTASGYIPKLQATFIFLKTIQDIVTQIGKLRKYRLWNSRKENHFVICRRVNDIKFLSGLMQTIWKQRILNFVVVFVWKRLEIFSYNPFKEEVINVTSYKLWHLHLFPDKLSNLYGYQLRVSLFNNFPLTTKENGEWIGEDYVRLQLVTSMINATFRIIESPENSLYDGAYDDIMNDVTDFCFISHYYMHYLYQGAEYTYTHQPDQIVAVVPFQHQSLFHNYTVFSIFDITVWVSSICMITILVIFTTMVNLLKKKVFRINCLQYFSTSLGNPLTNFGTQPFAIKILFLIFILSCIIFRTAFQCFLISTFVTPKPEEKMTTIAEFRESNLNIHTTAFLANMILFNEHLSDRVFNISAPERIKRLYSLDTSASYAIILTFANKFMESLKSNYAKPPFYILEEALVPGMDTYFFQRHSPYLEKIDECLLRLKQYALSEKRVYTSSYFKRNFTRSRSPVIVLGVEHLQSVFHILTVGLLLSVLVFICEIVVKKKFT
ncbi:hypothetical protein Zmor_007469 [Zophobas morio]|uniref:Ionotropic receptor n=1 Tax=Zophobas morio TaxID=2755281 RepID=A0AA38IS18_9CUCU|nr:hypothetical protein Zmor_007469 [Zophobas morio]